jgi:hypothetical protein
MKWKSKTGGIGINGIVYHQQGFLLLDNSNTGRIYKLIKSNPQDVSVMETEQYFLGSDGLLLNSKNTLMVVNGGTDKVYQPITEDHCCDSIEVLCRPASNAQANSRKIQQMKIYH